MGWNTDRNKYSKPETTDQQKNIFIFLKIIVFYLMFTSRHLSRLAHKYYFGILLPMFRYFFVVFLFTFLTAKRKRMNIYAGDDVDDDWEHDNVIHSFA